MPIEFFGGHQTDVYIPALLVLLVGAAVAVVPVIAAPRVARMRGRGLLVGVCALVAAVAVAGAIVLAVPATGRLADQRVTVRAAIKDRYGLDLPPGTVSDLVDGASVRLTPGQPKVRLQAVAAPGQYVLTTGGARGELPLAA